MKDFYLTVGELKRILEYVPDDMPVYYQRIEDWYFDPKTGSWDTVELKWENEKTESIRAFGAYVDDENNAFLIHAHY